MTLYALRRTAADTYSMAKFDKDFTVEATYTLIAKGHSFTCDCPANYRVKTKPCKHQKMMPYMMGACNVPRFFEPDTGRWHDLLEVAPGMAAEHAEGELVMGKDRTATEIENAPLARQGEALAKADAVLLEPIIERVHAAVDKLNGEPVTLTPVTGHVAQTQPERPMAPASAAPVVRRRI